MISAINEEIVFHKKEVLNLRAEKESLENVLAMKALEVRKTLNNEANRYHSLFIQNQQDRRGIKEELGSTES